MAAKKATKKSKPMAKKSVKAKVVKIKPVTAKAKSKVVKVSKAAKVTSKKPASKPLGKISKPLTKSELLSILADGAGLTRKQVSEIFDKLGEIVGLHLKGPEKFVLPGMFKIVVRKVPARPAREGKNPFTGETMMFKAKPASKKVKVLALSNLKGMCK